MQKITFENSINGLEITFSTATTDQFLADFDGNSAGSEAITYKPLGFNGQRLVRTSMSARTITATIQLRGEKGGKYSKEAVRTKWEQVQKVLVPGDMGRLTWSDGRNSRYIDCRVEATPKAAYELPFLLTATFAFIADAPLWFDTEEQVITFVDNQAHIYENDCGIAVPILFEVTTTNASSPWLMVLPHNGTQGFSLALFEAVPAGKRLVVDTSDCTVKLFSDSDFEYANQLLSTESAFGYLQPGENTIMCAWSAGCTAMLRYHKAYMGVG